MQTCALAVRKFFNLITHTFLLADSGLRGKRVRLGSRTDSSWIASAWASPHRGISRDGAPAQKQDV